MQLLPVSANYQTKRIPRENMKVILTTGKSLIYTVFFYVVSTVCVFKHIHKTDVFSSENCYKINTCVATTLFKKQNISIPRDTLWALHNHNALALPHHHHRKQPRYSIFCHSSQTCVYPKQHIQF